jgi:hypothetical protein
LNVQPRMHTDNELCVVALHDPQRHDCSWLTPVSRSEWRDRNAKAEGRAEGKIKGGGTRRPWTQTNWGGEGKTKNGMGVAQGPNGMTCARGVNNSGCKK